MAMISSSHNKSYDVFLSFRGEDTRYGITSHIYDALSDKKIKTYLDEKSLERGDEITPALLAAIERSTISVIVFSKDYATSPWCLSELVHIHKCRRDRGQSVVPIFYGVEPSHVRRQRQGSYRDAFKKHEKRHEAETIQQWRDALKESADLSGVHYSRSTRSEASLVKEVVDIILKKLNRETVDDDLKGLIGMRNHLRSIEMLFGGGPKLQIIGIWGMPGIGKTTIANVVFSRFFSQFEGHYFLRNVRETSQKYGLEILVDELLGKLVGDDEKPTSGILPSPLPRHVKDRLRRTKVLLVLDDVSERKQLEYLVSDHFSNNSTIIVTTRDEGVLRGIDIRADVVTYEVDLLNFKEALLLFSLTTFRQNSPPNGYQTLSSNVVKYVGRNPLAIKVLGSHLRSLRNPSKENWEMELDKLKKFPHNDIQDVLRISYDALDRVEQKIFLDIACFFKGMRRGFVQNILNGCNFFANTGIDDLIDKCLVTVDDKSDDVLSMHDLVQQMGWEIVRQESEEPGDRSRLWIAEDACYVFNNDTGSNKIEGIFLSMLTLDEDLHLNPLVFQRMKKMRLLRIYQNSRHIICSLHLESLQSLPPSLRYLEWHGYPLKSLPLKSSLRYLVQLTLPYSRLEQLWHGTERLDNLKGIDVRHSVHLSQIPDLSSAQNIETIVLENCTSLLEVPWHVFEKCDKLYDLNLGKCRNIENFPKSIDAKELKTLSLEGCHNLKTAPNIVSPSLVFLNLRATPIASMPSSICSIDTISELLLDQCKSLTSLPSSISQLHLLKTLNLNGCSSLVEFPSLPMNIEKLVMSGTPIERVPSSSIEGRSRLREMQFYQCNKLESLPPVLFKSEFLTTLDLSFCSALNSLPEISNHRAESNLEKLLLSGSGITHLIPSSLTSLTNLRSLELDGCRKLTVIDGLHESQLTSLSVSNCTKIQSIEKLPFTLKYLYLSQCTSLKDVLITAITVIPAGSSRQEAFEIYMEQRIRRFWNSGREVKFDTFDYSLLSQCFGLTPMSRDSILTEFQHKVLHMATQYVAPKYEVESSPAITTLYTGNEIPDWFDHMCGDSNVTSNSVTIKLPSEWRNGDILGFALCAIAPGGQCTMATDIFCKIEFIGEDATLLPESCAFSPFVGPTTTMVFPVDFMNQVVMWYKHCDYSSYKGGAAEVKVEFAIGKRGKDPSSHVRVKKCGVHILRADDLDDLNLIDENHTLQVKVENQDDATTNIDRPESSRARGGDEETDSDIDIEPKLHVSNTNDEDVDHSSSTIWSIVGSVWRPIALCCSRED